MAPSHVEFESTEPADGMLADGVLANGNGAPAAASESGGRSTGETVDFSFYSAFWRLQKAFSEPAKAVGTDAWAPLVEQLESVLQARREGDARPLSSVASSGWRCRSLCKPSVRRGVVDWHFDR